MGNILDLNYPLLSFRKFFFPSQFIYLTKIPTMKHFQFLLLSAVLLFSSCSKKDEEDDCTEPATPVATSGGDVYYGDTIYLFATTVPGVSEYSWTGPNGYTSSQQNPVIPQVTSAHSGDYHVKAVDGSCSSGASTVNVHVDVTVPCAPYTNRFNFNGVAAVSFSYVHGALDNTMNQYKITANGANGDAEIYFGRTTQPVEGVYELKSSSSFLTENQASVTMTASMSYWQNSSGFLYVTVSGGKVSASFCNTAFSESTFGWNTSGYGNLTEQ